METRRWLNHSQPQFLQNTTILLYINAVFSLLRLGSVLGLLTLAGAAAGYGIANEKKWGYYLALVVAIVPLTLTVLILLQVFGSTTGANFNLMISLIFEVLLVALLVHPTSRGYQKTWFK